MPAGLTGARLHLGWLFVSVVLAVVLLALLFLSAELDLAALGRVVLGVPPSAFGEIVLLLGLNSMLSGEKWRLIAIRLQHGERAAMRRPLYFAFTSIGVALGQIVPAQLSLVLSRSLGAHLHGGAALSRGMTATLFDYFFDVAVAGAVALATVLALITGGGATVWAAYASAICLAGFLLYGGAAGLARFLMRGVGGFGGRFGAGCAALAASPLMEPSIGRRLLAISGLRFVLLVLMNAVSARAIGADLALWQLGAALPFAVIANALALTPGSLGVNEWTVSSALLALGAPLSVSAQWALVSRVLAAGAAMLWGAAGLLIVAATRPPRPARAE